MKTVGYVSVLVLAIALGYIAHCPIVLIHLREYLQCSFLTENGSIFSFIAQKSGLLHDGGSHSPDVILHCHFKPLKLETLAEFNSHFQDIPPSMRGLLEWKKPNEQSIVFYADNFTHFLPPFGTEIGDVWNIVEPAFYFNEDDLHGLIPHHDSSLECKGENSLSNTAECTLHRILSMFHKNVFLQTRFRPRGTFAILRAHNSEFLDIVFRCHAEFQLNNPPRLPFWFTPAQFQGQLLIAKNSSKIIKFTISVPAHKRLNVDMEFMESRYGDMRVDIGYIPQMLINSTDSGWEQQYWDNQISLQEAHQKLERVMFPFKEVSYKPIEEALSELRKQENPLHCIVLWGALDDQSC